MKLALMVTYVLYLCISARFLVNPATRQRGIVSGLVTLASFALMAIPLNGTPISALVGLRIANIWQLSTKTGIEIAVLLPPLLVGTIAMLPLRSLTNRSDSGDKSDH